VDEPRTDTRARILQAALDLFVEQGYGRTSLRQIAERLQLTKAAILYYFPSKAHLLAAIAEPLVNDLEAAVHAAERLPAAQARWTVIECWVDALLSHRQSLGMLLHDLALVAKHFRLERLLQLAVRAAGLIAGPQAGDLERVRAIQALSMMGDPVVLTDIADEQLREHILDGVRRLLGQPPAPQRTIPAARARRRAGRPRSLDREQIAAIQRMYQSGSHTAEEIAAAFGVSRATVYRHLRDPDPQPI
jgi:AcrR family transcriptional regulator